MRSLVGGFDWACDEIGAWPTQLFKIRYTTFGIKIELQTAVG